MARPAGYSSDEDDLDGFYDESYKYTVSDVSKEQNETKNKQQKQNQFYLDIVNGNLKEVETAINEGLDVNENLQDNWSPLLLAASVGNFEVVKMLVQHGANLNYDRDKYTVLMAACNCPNTCADPKESFEIAKYLVGNGANVNATTRKRINALMFAASSGNLEIVKFLLSLCNKFAVDNQGWNVLFWAVNDNKPKVVKYLLEQGFSDNDVDVRGNKPLFYAKSQDLTEIIEMLPSYQEQIIDVECYDTNMNDFEEIFINLKPAERPLFADSVYGILYGVKSENLTAVFAKNNIDLKEFLSLNEETLLHLGVTMPFQRHKVLAGLYKFHKHPFTPKSIPIVQKNQKFSNIDVAKSIMASIRQLTAMEGSICFVVNNFAKSGEIFNKEELQTFQKSVDEIKVKIRKIGRTTRALKSRISNWDRSIAPADLITNDSRKFSKNCLRNRLIFGSILCIAALFGVNMLRKRVF